MKAEELLTWVKAAPFSPFKLVMSDGKTYEVRHPESIKVGKSEFLFYYMDDPQGPFDRFDLASLPLIRRVEKLEPANNSMPTVVDPATGNKYVLVRLEEYERVKTILADEGQEFVRGMYAPTMELFGREGWNDPSMDIYNDLDPRRQK